ncbi:hypothetical protein K502DRAFT_228469 [Neoconidiobolus thromboides FSU 785]|nr:hypothetical protein K502DRAFT_228469 [Neoconidiobolus thromboides FSU 785]
MQCIMLLIKECGIELMNQSKYIVNTCIILLTKFSNNLIKKINEEELQNNETKMRLLKKNEDFNFICILITLLSNCLNENLNELTNEDWLLLASLKWNLKKLVQIQLNEVELTRNLTSLLLLIESINIKVIQSNLNKQTESKEKIKQPKLDVLKFQQAVSQLQDSLIAVRAAGVITLGEIVDNKNEIIYSKEYQDKIIQLLLVALNEEDSFIYLQSIKAISNFMIIGKGEIVNKIIQEYNNINKGLDYQLRIGEILINFIKLKGDTMDKELFDKLLSALFTELRRNYDEDKSNNENSKNRNNDTSLLEIENKNENNNKKSGSFDIVNNEEEDSEEEEQIKIIPSEVIKVSSLSILGILYSRVPLLFITINNSVIDMLLNILLLNNTILLKRVVIINLYDIIRGYQLQLFDVLSKNLVDKIIDRLNYIINYYYHIDGMLTRHSQRTLNYLNKVKSAWLNGEDKEEESNSLLFLNKNKDKNMLISETINNTSLLNINNNTNNNLLVSYNSNAHNLGLSQSMIDKLKFFEE